MTPQELKNSILQMAIQGKLVEQRPEDGTAQELLKKLPKPKKSLPGITEDEIPFDIPVGWIWLRLGNAMIIERGGSPRPIKEYLTTDENGLNWIKIGDTEKGGKYINGTEERIKPEGLKKTRLVHKGDFLLSNSMSFGRPYILNIDGCIHDGWLVLHSTINVFDKDFLYYLLSSSMVYSQFASRVAGAVVNNLNSDKVALTLVPVPPLAEQHRIVAKIESLLPLIDRYEKAWTRLEDFNKRFPGDMQKSILQMAIQGKLVEQHPEEGTGEELYQQIQQEKARLVKEGKIKKEKPLPEIAEDEVPFEVPETWKWVRLSDICSVTDGTHQTPHYVENGMPFISAQNVKPYRFVPDIHRDVSYEDFLEYNKTITPTRGDILMTRVGAGIGEAAIIDQDFQFSIYVSLTLIKCYLKGYDMRYLLYVINSPLGLALAKKKTLGKGASQGNLNLCFIREFVMPLPPLAEQKRIVARLEELLPLCERLK